MCAEGDIHLATKIRRNADVRCRSLYSVRQSKIIMNGDGAARHRSLMEALDAWAEKTPDKTALTFLDDAGEVVEPTLSYGDLRRRVDGLAAHLKQELCLAKGSTCLLVYPPSLDFTVAFLACLRAGVIAVPCFPPDPKRLKKDLNMFTSIQGSSGATVALTNKMYNYAKKVSMTFLLNLCTVLIET